MLRGSLRAVAALTLAALPLTAAHGQDKQVAGYSVASRDQSLTFFLQDGSQMRIAVRDGQVLVNGEAVATYAARGPVDQGWQQLLARASDLDSDQMVVAARDWQVAGLEGADQPALAAVRTALSGLRPAEAGVTVPPVPAVPPVPVIASGDRIRVEARAAADEARVHVHEVRDAIREAVRDVPRGQFQMDFAEGGGVTPFAPIQSIPNGLLGLLGAFLALGGIAFGASFFAERQLDIVADTARASLARSFFVGLFAQPLILPAFGMVIAGLVLTVVGILLVPVAIAAFVATLLIALVAGYLAMARAAGEQFAARRGMDLEQGAFGTLRKTGYGLAVLLAIWLPAVALGWAPVAGPIVHWTAILVTWAIVTTGFGAAILTRGGLRGTFGRKFAPRPMAELAWKMEEPAVDTFATDEWLAGKRD